MSQLKFLKIPILDKGKKQFGQRIKIENKEEISINEIIVFLENIKQKKYTFINLSKELAENDKVLSLLNRENIVLISDYPTDDYKTAAYVDFSGKVLERADFIIIRSLSELEDAKKYDVDLIYENVKTEEEFEKLKNIEKIKYFEGYFFVKLIPINIKNESLKSSKLDLINLFNIAIDEFDIKKIEEELKRSPDLSLQLLRYVNSAAFSFRSNITSIKHAVSILGQKQFINWILLQMYSTEDNSNNYLLETAAIRAKMMEILAEQVGKSKENGFLVGILSLSNVLLEINLEDILSQINVDEYVKKSLLQKDTKLGKLLNIIEKLEEENIYLAEKFAKELGLNINNFMEAQLKAIAWYNQIHIG